MWASIFTFALLRCFLSCMDNSDIDVYNYKWKKIQPNTASRAWRPKGLGVPPSAERYGGFSFLELLDNTLFLELSL